MRNVAQLEQLSEVSLLLRTGGGDWLTTEREEGGGQDLPPREVAQEPTPTQEEHDDGDQEEEPARATHHDHGGRGARGGPIQTEGVKVKRYLIVKLEGVRGSRGGGRGASDQLGHWKNEPRLPLLGERGPPPTMAVNHDPAEGDETV